MWKFNPPMRFCRSPPGRSANSPLNTYSRIGLDPTFTIYLFDCSIIELTRKSGASSPCCPESTILRVLYATVSTNEAFSKEHLSKEHLSKEHLSKNRGNGMLYSRKLKNGAVRGTRTPVVYILVYKTSAVATDAITAE